MDCGAPSKSATPLQDQIRRIAARADAIGKRVFGTALLGWVFALFWRTPEPRTAWIELLILWPIAALLSGGLSGSVMALWIRRRLNPIMRRLESLTTEERADVFGGFRDEANSLSIWFAKDRTRVPLLQGWRYPGMPYYSGIHQILLHLMRRFPGETGVDP